MRRSRRPSDASESADATTPLSPVAPEVFELATETAAFVGGAYLDAPSQSHCPRMTMVADPDEDGRPGIGIRIEASAPTPPCASLSI